MPICEWYRAGRPVTNAPDSIRPIAAVSPTTVKHDIKMESTLSWVAPAILSPVFFPVRTTHPRQGGALWARRYVHHSPPGNFMESAQALRGARLPANGVGTRAAPGGQFGARTY